jgi:hypothetical protein
MNEEQLSKIHSWARDIFQKFLPEDLTLFRISWPTYLSLLKKIDLKALTYEAFESQVSHQEGFAYPGKSGVIPPIIYALSASFESLSSLAGKVNFERIQGTVRDNLTYWEVPKENKAKIINHISRLLEIEFSGGETPDKIQKSSIKTIERKFTAEELSNPEFEFNDKLEISWQANNPSVKLNGDEIITFRRKESLFINLLYLATARKEGNGWVDRAEELLDLRGHRISELRNIFGLIDVKGVSRGLGKEVIKSDNRGYVKLALKPDSIFIDKAIVGFKSRYEERLVFLLEYCMSELKEFEKNREQRTFVNFLDTIRKVGREFRIYDINMKLLKKPMELLGQAPKWYEEHRQIQKNITNIKNKAKEYIEEHPEWYKRLSGDLE